MQPAKIKFGRGTVSLRKVGRIRRRLALARHLRRSASFFFICIALFFFGPAARGAPNDANKAVFLVARDEIQDPFFKQSVVLMLPETDNPLVVGLIINKPTRITLWKLFPETPEFKGGTETAYFGGPVHISAPSVVFHSKTAPEHAVRLYGDVYLSFDPDEIDAAFQNSQQASSRRLFLGRAQWAPGQLQNEFQRGSWYRVEDAVDLVFSPNPEALWRKLHDRAAPSKYIRYRLPAGPAPGNRAKGRIGPSNDRL
jgi:putative transcriptional regulator